MADPNAQFPERIHRPSSPAPWEKKETDQGGPKRPDVDAPDTNWLQGKWWFYSTVAEALFGLGGFGDEEHYDTALAYLERGRVEANPPEWEFESTVRQLASLARLQSPAGASAKDLEDTAAWRTLAKFLGHTAPVRSAVVEIGISPATSVVQLPPLR